MSDKPKSGDSKGDPARDWVPSPEQPVPPTTTEFNALVDAGAAVPPEAAAAEAEPEQRDVEPEPAVVEAEAEAAETPEPESAPEEAEPSEPAAEAPAPDPEPEPEPEPAAVVPEPEPAAVAPEPTPEPVAPAWSPPAGGSIPPVGDDTPTPSNQAGTLGGLIPEDRPEVLLAAAFAGGVLAAIILRTLVRR